MKQRRCGACEPFRRNDN